MRYATEQRRRKRNHLAPGTLHIYRILKFAIVVGVGYLITKEEGGMHLICVMVRGKTELEQIGCLLRVCSLELPQSH